MLVERRFGIYGLPLFALIELEGCVRGQVDEGVPPSGSTPQR